MSKLRQRFLNLNNLDAAWKKVAKNQGCSGVDGETIQHFSQHKDKNLKKLQKSLIDKTYKPLPLRQIWIPKDSGKWRELRIPTVRDRIIQQALLQVLHPIVEEDFAESSFAYRPNRSHLMAAQQVAKWRDKGYDWVLDGDIVQYFDNIVHCRLLDELKESVDLIWVLELIKNWIGVGALTKEGILLPQKGIPQGAVISPLLANVYLDDFDESFDESDLKLIRYADDFVVLSKSEKRIIQAQEEVIDILDEMGLELHPTKSQITNFRKGFKFLGHVFTEELMFSSKNKSKKETEVKIKREESRIVHSNSILQPTAMQLALLESLKEINKPIPPPLYVVLGYAVRKPEKVIIQSNELIWSQAMSSLYLVHQGSMIKKEQGRFIIEAPQQETVEIPIQEIERIMIFGQIQISTTVIETCLQLKISVIFLSQLGEYKGHLSSGEEIDLVSQMAQFKKREDEKFRILVAKEIVKGKLLNSKQFLLRLNPEMLNLAIKLYIDKDKNPIQC